MKVKRCWLIDHERWNYLHFSYLCLWKKSSHFSTWMSQDLRNPHISLQMTSRIHECFFFFWKCFNVLGERFSGFYPNSVLEAHIIEYHCADIVSYVKKILYVFCFILSLPSLIASIGWNLVIISFAMVLSKISHSLETTSWVKSYWNFNSQRLVQQQIQGHRPLASLTELLFSFLSNPFPYWPRLIQYVSITSPKGKLQIQLSTVEL